MLADLVVTDPRFYLAAVPAVLLTGISKSGFSGGVGALTVPLMALFISPVAAAAIMLPILCVMDVMGIYAYRGSWHRRNLLLLLPGAALGMALGVVTFNAVDENIVRMVLGLVTLLFALSYFVHRTNESGPREAKTVVGVACGILSGFTSFIAHAGGPPVKFFLLRQNLDKTLFVGTNVVFFFILNQIKVLPYAWLGQFSARNLMTSLLLAPLAPLGTWIGLRLHRRIPSQLFYRISYALMIVAGLKLLLDGVHAGSTT